MLKDDHVYTNNGHSACVIDLNTGVNCAVDIRAIEGIVCQRFPSGWKSSEEQSSESDDGIVSVDGETFTWAEGKKGSKQPTFKATLQTVSLDQEVFTPPPMKAVVSARVTSAFADAIAEVKDFADIDGRFPNRRGVRLEFGRKKITFCAHRGQFAVRLSVGCIGEGELRGGFAIIAQESVDLIVSAFRMYGTDAEVQISESAVMFKFAERKAKQDVPFLPACTLYCIQPSIDPTNRQERLDYASMFTEMKQANEVTAESFFNRPFGFREAVARCLFVKDNTDATHGAKIKVGAGSSEMLVVGRGARGKVVTRIKLPPNIKAKITSEFDPTRLGRIVELADKIALGSADSMVFSGSGFEGIMFYHNSAVTEKEEAKEESVA